MQVFVSVAFLSSFFFFFSVKYRRAVVLHAKRAQKAAISSWNERRRSARKNGGNALPSRITGLISTARGLLGFAFTSSSMLRLRRQRDSLTLKAVSHPRRAHTSSFRCVAARIKRCGLHTCTHTCMRSCRARHLGIITWNIRRKAFHRKDSYRTFCLIRLNNPYRKFSGI